MNKGLGIGIIGAGKVGTALALSLSKAGYKVSAVASRSFSSTQQLAKKLSPTIVCANPQAVSDASDLIFITTPDAAISKVASSITPRPEQMICHVSATGPIGFLDSLSDQGAITGVFHPLQAVGSVGTEIIPGINFAIEAQEPLLSILRDMAESLGGRVVELSGSDRVLYHASAIIASNYLVSLVDMAAELWRSFGTREQAQMALLPLIRGTIDNIERVGIPGCLTGPIARGDTDTVQSHIIALTQKAPQLLRAYKMLGLMTIPLAMAKGGIDKDASIKLNALLEV